MTAGALFSDSAQVEVRETHGSRVFLTVSDVYKLKKPVNLGFLDYSTPARRGRMCRQEVALNQRLAPDVYLGVERLTRGPDGALRFNGRGPVVDYLVHMRRLPDDRALDAQLRAGKAGQDEVRNVGAILGAFHAAATPAPVALGPATFRRNARENFEQVRTSWPATLPRHILGEISARFSEALEGGRAEIAQRAEAGRVRDGHGDLRMEHVYLEERIEVIDCVEFSKRYRASDTALDFAFLVMDMESSGFPDLVDPLVEAYESQMNDDICGVRRLYTVYRALVRAKVAFILAEEGDVPDATRRAGLLGARQNVHYALQALRGGQAPMLIAVGGLPGTGKSTLARALADTIGATVRSADETRKRLAGLDENVHPEHGIDDGIYSDAMNKRVYGSLLDHAVANLNRGRNCILDATFRREEDLDAVGELAARHGAKFVSIRCTAPEKTVLERLTKRETTPDPWSDATVETYFAHRREAGGEHPAATVTVATTLPMHEQVDVVLGHLWE